jgi:hypothetical protein
MATFYWEVYAGTPSWVDVSANTIVFSGTGGLATPITLGEWQSETHLGSGDPGTDQCGVTHMPNVKYVDDTHFDGGSGSELLNDTNLLATECTLRIRFTDAASVATSGARFYAFDGSVVTNEAVGVEVEAFEQGKGNSSWTLINDDSANVGGDNTGERLALADQAAATEHIFYIAVSVKPESVGSKTSFDFGIALTYS